MFENLSDKLDRAFKVLKGQGTITEINVAETMKEIRKIPNSKDVPIVAVTAKAMKGDRERCIEAGAWDYLSKPVDREQLLSVLKAWLQR